MGTLVTPEYVQELASYLDVKDVSEWALPYALASAALPEGWTCLISDNGTASFVSETRPDAPQREHPLLDRAAQALAQLRATASGSIRGGAPARHLLGPFENLDSPAVELFYLDVNSGERVPEFECPPGSLVPPLPDDLLRILTTGTEPGSGSGPQPAPGSGSESGSRPHPDLEAHQPGEDDPQPGSSPASPASPTLEQIYGEPAGAVRYPDPATTTAPGVPGAGPGSGADAGSGRAPRPGSAAGRSSRPPSAAPSASTSRHGVAAAGGSAAGSPRPPGSPSNNTATDRKSISREGSARSVGSTRGAGSTTGGVEAATPPPGAAGPAARTGSGLSRDGRRGSQTSNNNSVGAEPSRGSVAGTAAAAAAGVDAAGRSSRPTSAAAAAAAASPVPAPPAVAMSASGGPSRSQSRSSSSGLGADENEYEEDARAGFRRDASTTAGYAGSISDTVSVLGTTKATSAKSMDSAAATAAVAAAPSGGSGGGGGGGAPASLSRSGSARSGASAASGGTARSGSARVSGSASLSGSGSGRGSGSGSVGGNSSNGRSGGGGGGGTGGVGTRPAVAPPSGRLTFYGWWFEDVESTDLVFRISTKPTAGGGLAPRHCALIYDFGSGTFTLNLRDPVTPPAPGQPYDRVPELSVPNLAGDQVAMEDTGRPAGVWDLHLGARLRVLGKPVVLKNSDLASAQWHSGYFRQLCRLRDTLTQEVQKYKPRVLRPGLVCDKGDVRLQTGQQLRHVALQVRELIEDLRQYRPAKAESFLAALPIQF